MTIGKGTRRELALARRAVRIAQRHLLTAREAMTRSPLYADASELLPKLRWLTGRLSDLGASRVGMRKPKRRPA